MSPARRKLPVHDREKDRFLAGFEPGTGPMPLDKLVCWYQYDPGTKRFAKGCAQ